VYEFDGEQGGAWEGDEAEEELSDGANKVQEN
jgi:hypothetical protein